MPKSLKQAKAELNAKRAQLAEVFEHKTTNDDGESVYDLTKFDADWVPDDVKELKGHAKTIRVLELHREKSQELDALQDEVFELEKAEQRETEHKRRESTPANPISHPEGGEKDGKRREVKSLGKMIVESEGFKAWSKGDFREQIKLDDIGFLEHKTLFETTAGWGPESTRTGRVVDAVTRPLQLIDILPTGQTGQASVVYMEETTRTHAAAEKAEGAAYAESTFVLTQRTEAVQKVTDSVPVTDEQLEDVAMAESYLEGRLNFGIQQRLDAQCLVGDGTPPNLSGIMDRGTLQTQDGTGDAVPDAIYKGMTNVSVTGRAMATHVVMHPTDWQNHIRLLKTGDGIYIWGNPAEAGPERIWGLPLVKNEAFSGPTGTALVGSFMPAWIQLIERRGIVIDVGYVGDQFKEGKRTIRASGRWAIAIYRPPAFCEVTNLGS